MFDYNPKQNPISGVCSIKTLSTWKIKQQPLENDPPQFIYPHDLQIKRTNSILEIQCPENNEHQFIDSINFSSIQPNSPTSYSSFYSSINQDRYLKFLPPINCNTHKQSIFDQFNPEDQPKYCDHQEQTESKQPKHKQKGYQLDKQTNYLGKLDLKKEKDAQMQDVPIFFIKMPLHLRDNQAQSRKNLQNKINDQLEDIYKGKYKICRSEQPS